MTPKKSYFPVMHDAGSADTIGKTDEFHSEISSLIVNILLSDQLMRKLHLFKEGGEINFHLFPFYLP